MEYYNWRTSGYPPGAPPYNRCSPNLVTLQGYLRERWGCWSLGCYNVRSIRNGTSQSLHSWGAAIDLRYATDSTEPGWQAKRDEIVAWLIENHEALGVMGINDYVGSRIWRCHRGWKANTTASGMGEAWATYFHIETDRANWSNSTPIPERLADQPVTPPPVDNSWMEQTVNALETVSINTPGRHPDTMRAQALVNLYLQNKGDEPLVEDGWFGAKTDVAVRSAQTFRGLTADGVVGPRTWQMLLGVQS